VVTESNLCDLTDNNLQGTDAAAKALDRACLDDPDKKGWLIRLVGKDPNDPTNVALRSPGEKTVTGATTLGGRIPVNASGGLACFGEAVPAQAIAQVCELTWQLRGQAAERQVEGAKVGLSVNQGLFGHGSSVIVKR